MNNLRVTQDYFLFRLYYQINIKAHHIVVYYNILEVVSILEVCLFYQKFYYICIY